MGQDPTAWAKLGQALRDDRERQQLTREDLAARIEKAGYSITTRTISNLERGTVPRRRNKPPSVEVTAAALGWPAGKVDRILDGGDPHEDTPATTTHERLFNDPRAQAIWELDLPLAEREQGIRDLMEADLRRAREREQGQRRSA
jgi:transcriptional regulator with XRE-family HTH domain